MRYRLLGRTGLRVSELCLGTMTFGEDWGWGAPLAECERIVDAFAQSGGNFIDTADRYTNGSAERYVGQLVRRDRERFVLATKYTLARRGDDPNGAGNHRKSLVHALEGSLERLGTDYIDLLWVHIWDLVTPVDELMRALDDQVRAGRVLYVGVSDTPAWMVAYANALADARGWTPFCALQGQYSLLERTVEREYVPMAQALDLALLAWAPLAAGLLTGKYRKETESTPVSGRLNVLGSGAEQLANERTARIVEAVGEVAAAVGCTPAQVALAWLGSRSGVVIPIIGARSEGQLRENLGALEVELDGEQLARLERASAVELGFPHDFMAEVEGQPWAYGDLWPMLADHRLGHTARRLPAPGPG